MQSSTSDCTGPPDARGGPDTPLPHESRMQVQAPTPAAPPDVPAAPSLQGLEAQAPATAGTAAPSASEMYEAAKAQRNELNRQLGQLEEKRRAIASRLREGEVSGADKAGLEARLTNLDARILSMNQELAAADARVAQTAGVPGAVQASRPEGARRGPPEEVIVMGFVLAMTMVLPISIAIARRIWKRGTPATSSAPMSREMDERLGRLEQAMDAVAVEVERVGEGQRFVTRVLGAGAAEPLAVRAREEIEVPR